MSGTCSVSFKINLSAPVMEMAECESSPVLPIDAGEGTGK